MSDFPSEQGHALNSFASGWTDIQEIGVEVPTIKCAIEKRAFVCGHIKEESKSFATKLYALVDPGLGLSVVRDIVTWQADRESLTEFASSTFSIALAW